MITGLGVDYYRLSAVDYANHCLWPSIFAPPVAGLGEIQPGIYILILDDIGVPLSLPPVQDHP